MLQPMSYVYEQHKLDDASYNYDAYPYECDNLTAEEFEAECNAYACTERGAWDNEQTDWWLHDVEYDNMYISTYFSGFMKAKSKAQSDAIDAELDDLPF